MTYRLLIGQRAYSSWSLRGWLPFDVFGIEYELHQTEIYGESFAREVAEFAGGLTVPAVITPDGGRLADSLSIAWHLADAFPERGLLPTDPGMRAEALSLIAEMHSGFVALRSTCPMNLWTAWDGYEPDESVRADLARLDGLLSTALDRSGGPFLHGAFTLADVFYAPVAARIASYRLPVSPTIAAYAETQLGHLSMRRWRAMALAQNITLDVYDKPFTRAPYPSPPTLTAKAVDSGPSENDACLYSGKPVTHFLELDGKIWGFCNAFCRDKTLHDPQAWPEILSVAGLSLEDG